MIGLGSAIPALSSIAPMTATQRSSAAKQAAAEGNGLLSLTSEDRALIKKGLGVDIGADGLNSDGRALAPLAVWIIASDRERGVLPAGQPIDQLYLANLRKGESAGGAANAGIVAQIDALIAAVGNTGTTRLDART